MNKKKNKKIENNNQVNITNKILNLCFYQQIEESYYLLKLIEKQIEFCELQIKYLNRFKPYWFQKKKLISHNEDIQKLKNKICNYYIQINNELKIIEELKENIKN